MNRSTPLTFLIATRNAHKVGEIRAILGKQFNYLTLNDFPDAPPVIEDAPTFTGNATKKAVELAKWLASTRNIELGTRNFFVLADDSGLEVDALNGAPGVFSARFASLESGTPGNSPDSENNAKLLRLLKEIPMEKRTARFRCVLALAPVDVEGGPVGSGSDKGGSPVCFADELELLTENFDGTCEGRIDFAPRGQGGFGYDPLFIPHRLRAIIRGIGGRDKKPIEP